MLLPLTGAMTPLGVARGRSLPPSTNLKLWFRASTLGLSNGAPVATLTDSSPNANHATQATTANQATYATNAINGKAAISCDGNDYYSLTSSAVVSALHFWVVVKHNSLVLQRYLVGTGVALRLQGSGSVLRISNDSFATNFSLSPSISTSWIVLEVSCASDGTVAIRVGGTAAGSGTLAPASFTFTQLFSGDYLVGSVADLLLYDAVQSGSALTQIRSYLSSEYGLSA